MTEDKVRENRLRRMAERRGYILKRSRRRDPQAIDYGGYMLVEATRNFAVVGSDVYAFSATLDDIEQFFSEPPIAKRTSERKHAKTKSR